MVQSVMAQNSTRTLPTRRIQQAIVDHAASFCSIRALRCYVYQYIDMLQDDMATHRANERKALVAAELQTQSISPP